MLYLSEDVDVFDLYHWLNPPKELTKEYPKLLTTVRGLENGVHDFQTIKTERELQNTVAV